MTRDHSITVRYWGTTGSYARTLSPQEINRRIASAATRLARQESFRSDPNPDPERVQELMTQLLTSDEDKFFGGETTCIEIHVPGALIIIDLGSGFYALDRALNSQWNDPQYQGNRAAHILLTHGHLDHVSALPLAKSLRDVRNHFTLWSDPSVLQGLRSWLGPGTATTEFLVPVTFDVLSAIKKHESLVSGNSFRIGGAEITPFALSHPGGSLGFRIEVDQRVIVIGTDNEIETAGDEELRGFFQDADLLYADAQYRLREYQGLAGVGNQSSQSLVGWGHSPVEYVVEAAATANVKTLHLGHHEPSRSDAELAAIEAEALACMQKLAASGQVDRSCQIASAYDGLTVKL